MIRNIITVLILLNALIVLEAKADQTIISCTSVDPRSKFELHPGIYLDANKNILCFNVKGWPGYRGNNCVGSGQKIKWNAIVILFDRDGNSLGRDETDFQVSNVSITNEEIRYYMEWGRSGKWLPKQRIQINRLTGDGVDWFVSEHGGQPIKCNGNARKF